MATSEFPKNYQFLELISKAQANKNSIFPLLTSPFPIVTPTEKQEAACLCQEMKWVWKLSQLIGVNPLSLRCENSGNNIDTPSINFELNRSKLDSTKGIKCRLERIKFSFPFIKTVTTLIIFCAVGCVSNKVVEPFVKEMFMGTDAYAFKLHVLFRILQINVVLFCGLVFNRHLICAWKSIQEVVGILNHKFPPNFKLIIQLLTVGTLIMGASNALYTIFMGMRFCFVDEETGMRNVRKRLTQDLEELKKGCLESGPLMYIMFVWTLVFCEYVHITLASFLFSITLAVNSLHKALAQKFENTLKMSVPNTSEYYSELNLITDEGASHQQLDQKLEHLRLIYENLCGTVVHLRRFFGVSCLYICCDGILTIIFGFYWRIIYFENLADEDGDTADLHHQILFSLQSLYSVYSLMMILISGQLLIHSALKVPTVLRKSRICHLNSSAKFQISLLMQVSAGFPTRLSVFAITNLEMPFIAAASTNVITYLLVLMQFRLEQKNSKT